MSAFEGRGVVPRVVLGEVLQGFDADDLRSKVGEHHRAVGAGVHVGKIGDTNAFKRQWKRQGQYPYSH